MGQGHPTMALVSLAWEKLVLLLPPVNLSGTAQELPDHCSTSCLSRCNHRGFTGLKNLWQQWVENHRTLKNVFGL